MPRNLLLVLAYTLAIAVAAQPTWRFHLAFEDGTGAKDTLWFIYDTAVTQTQSHWPLESAAYVQSQSLLNYGDGSFHVFTINDFIDSTNTMAFPYIWFPIFETGDNIDAINWTPPMTIRWDTSLFHAPYLPYAQGSVNRAYLDGNYFFFHSNDGSGDGFNMLTTNSVFVDEDVQILFPFSLYFSGEGSTIGIEESPASTKLNVWPNPASHWLHFPLIDGAARFTVRDQLGRLVQSEMLTGHAAHYVWDISSLPPETYHITLESPQKPMRHAEFQKVE